MRNKINKVLKVALITSIILLLTIFIYSKLTKQKVFAVIEGGKSGAEATEESKKRPLDDVKEWTEKKDKDGELYVKNPPIVPTLSELLPAEQVTDDGLYITTADLHNLPSLFCCAKGVALPSISQTIVRSGDRKADTTDQGKKTAYLTVDDIPIATVFKNENIISDWIDGDTYPDASAYLSPADSKTLAKFHLVELRDCTPAEAWVLAEYDKNVTSIATTFEMTDEEYTGGDLGESVSVGSDTLYLVGDTGEERYVIEKEGKYYYVNLDDVSEYAPYSYVQYAWWKIKTVGDNKTSDIKDTDLAHEAEAFEDYIKSVSGVSDVKDLKRNEDGAFTFDYKVSMTPENSEDIKVTFNSETNRYILGPFSANYEKHEIQVGDRAKVNFSGIDHCILTGTDAEGNELLDADGNSVLKLNENFWFTYDHDHEHELSEDDKKEPRYEYPVPEEEFYLEISYLDDLAAIKSFKFDFQYKTANGQYEYYEGTYLNIHWAPDFDEEDCSVDSSSSTEARIIDNHITIASSRTIVNNGSGGGADAVGKMIAFTEERPMNESDPSWDKPFALFNDWPVHQESELSSIDDNYITITGRIVKGLGYGSGSPSLTITSITADGSESATFNGTSFVIKYKRDYTKAIVNQDCPVSISYRLSFSPEYKGQSVTSPETGTISKEFNLFYVNKLLGDYVKVGGANEKIKILGNKIYVKGLFESALQEIDFDAVMIHPETPQDVVYYWDIVEGDALSIIDSHAGRFQVVKPGTCKILCATGDGGPSVEAKVFEVVVPEFCFENDTTMLFAAAGEPVTYYNAVEPVSAHVEKIIVDGCLQSILRTHPDKTSGTYTFTLSRNRGYYKSLPDLVPVTITDGSGRTLNLNVGIAETEGDGDAVNKDDLITDNTVDPTPSNSQENENENDNSTNNGTGKGNGGSGSGDSGNGGNGNGGNGNGGSGNGGSGNGGSGSGDSGNGGSGSGDSGNGGSGSGDSGNGGNGNGGNGNGGSGNGGSGNGGSGSGGSGNGGSGNGGSGSGDSGSGSGDSDKGDVSGDTTGTPGGDSSAKYKYKFYLRATSASHQKAQAQANAVGSHDVVEVTAENGLAEKSTLTPVELEMLDIPLDLRTSLSGMVWIDHDEAKDRSTGTLGVFDGIDTPAPENSVEIMVWKVIYEKSGSDLKEVDREKAIAWKEDGTVIDFIEHKLFIDSEGKYKIPEIQVPSVEGLDTSKYVASYDVEFVYDGQTYEATEYLKSTGKDTVEEKLAEFKKTPAETAGEAKDYTTYAKDSYIVENADERKKFDSYFAEVYGEKPIDKESGETQGKSTGGDNSGIYDTDEYRDPERKETTLNYNSKSVVLGSDGNLETTDSTDDTNSKLQSTLITRDSEGYVLDQYRFASRTSEAGLLLPYESQYHLLKENYNNIQIHGIDFKPIDEYFNQINLGLLQRYETDISVQKDLYSGKVVVNKQETTYKFNSLAPLTEDALKQQLDLSYREQNYKIGLYNSDYYYRSSVYNSVEDELTKTVLQSYKENTELRLFVTYKIRLYNGSEHTDVSINGFKDYYDKTFTLVNDEEIKADILDNEGNSHEKVIAEKPYYRKLKPSDEDTSPEEKTELYRFNKEEDLVASQIVKDSSGKPITGELSFDYMKDSDNPLTTENGEFKYATSDDLNALNESKDAFDERLSLTPGQSMEVFVTYEVDREGFTTAAAEEDYTNPSERESLLGKKCNIAELTRFSTAYTEESVARHKTTRYSAGQISGRVDRNSAPDNVNMTDTNRDNVDIKYFEDDTETAPTLTVDLKTGDPRTIDGVVWEDSRGKADDGSELPYGDGIYNEGETVIPKVDVTLVEKIKINAGDVPEATLDDLEHEFEYVWPDDAFGDLDFKSRVQTDESGKYEFKNFTSGLYVVRFEYGNSEDTLKYNGQDYKNTSYQTGMTNAEPASDGSTVTGIDEYNVPGNATLNNEWHDLSSNENARTLETTRVSDVRDYEPRRIKVNTYSRTITNKNAEVLAAYVDDNDKNLTEEYKKLLDTADNKQALIDNTAMVANTAKFNVEIEKQDSIAYKTVETTQGDQQNNRVGGLEGDGTSHEYKITNVDFGLVRRPETRINIRKELNTLKLSKNDGSEVVLSVNFDENGDIDDASGKKSANVNKITEIKKQNLNDDTQGFKYVAIEASFLKGLTVQMTYRITIENNSEKDYVGSELAYYKNMQDLYNLVARYEEEGHFDTGEGIVYGKYLGLNYYTNNCYTGEIESGSASSKYGTNYDDVIVKTTVDQLIDYVDNDLSIDKSVSEAGILDNYWLDSSTDDRTNKLSQVSYVKDGESFTKVDTALVDNKNRTYYSKDDSSDATRNNLVLSANSNMEKNDTITFNKTKVDENKAPKFTSVEGGSLVPELEEVTLTDVYTSKEGMSSATRSAENEKLTTELEPGQKTETFVSTSAQANEEGINNMNYDNLVEIVMYSNSVGRRDTEAIPGNANMIAKQLSFDRASYNYDYVEHKYEPKHVQVGDGTGVKTIDTERDTFAPRDTVTFSEPTGLSLRAENINRIVRIILISLVIAAIAVIATTITVVTRKKKYDDDEILKAKDNK